jgi:hypothetical protein
MEYLTKIQEGKILSEKGKTVYLKYARLPYLTMRWQIG